MKNKGLTKEDSEIIAFVAGCLLSGVITKDELSQWAVHVITKSDGDYPLYLLDLIDFNKPSADIYNVIGFSPHWSFTNDDDKALYGIALKRGKTPYEKPCSPEEAFEKLDQRPALLRHFKEIFPFVEI